MGTRGGSGGVPPRWNYFLWPPRWISLWPHPTETKFMTPPKIFALVNFLLSKLHFSISWKNFRRASRAKPSFRSSYRAVFKIPQKFWRAARAEIFFHRGGTPPVISLFMTPPVRQKFMTPPSEKFPCAPMTEIVLVFVLYCKSETIFFKSRFMFYFL